MSKASPNPNKISPNTNITIEINGGRIVKGFGELQNNLGTALTLRKLKPLRIAIMSPLFADDAIFYRPIFTASKYRQ
jgi:hypothetical protein